MELKWNAPCLQVPLNDASVDLAVFCLSLMGTNLADFLAEANRVLKKRCDKDSAYACV